MGRRFAAVAFVLSVFCLAAGSASSLAGSSPPGSGPFAQFVACMKAHGAPALGHHGSDKGKSSSPGNANPQGSGSHEHGKPHDGPGKLSEADRAALKAAFAACHDLLPKRTAKDHGDHSGHGFARPTAAQFAAFKTCMAGKGFSRDKAGSGKRPDFRDPAVRSALKAAFKACLPLLKPASTG